MSKSNSLLFFSCLLFIWLLPASAYSDGTVIPTYVGKLPEIPSQRAIIGYRNGKETLVIETSFDGKGEKFGWIIPVPSLPTNVDKISPDFLNHLSLITQPNAIHYLGLTVLAIIFFPIITVIILSVLYEAYGFLKRFFIYGFILLVIAFCAIPSFMSYRGGGGTSFTGIKIISNQIVGNYGVSIIEAEKVEVLNKWLEGNGFISLNKKGIEIANEYIDKNWYFVAAKLIREKKELSSTHPILIEFETEAPIYPIRLTSINKSDMDIELFLVSNSEAHPKNYELEKTYTSRFNLKELTYSSEYEKNIGNKVKSTVFCEHIAGKSSKQIIGGMDAEKVLWDGCVITKFFDDIKSYEMADDLFFTFDENNYPVHYYRKRSYSKNAAILLSASIAYTIGLLLFMHIKLTLKKDMPFPKKGLLLIVALPIIISVSIYIFLGDKIEIEAIRCRSNFPEYDLTGAYTHAQAFFFDNKNKFPSERDLKKWGYVPSGCSMIVVRGNNKSDLTMEAFPIKGTGDNRRAYFLDTEGKSYWTSLDF